MSKTAVIILSSPRKGSNSGVLGRAVAEGLAGAGSQAETIDIAGLDIKPCLACGNCQRNGGRCSQVDGMHTVYPKLREASVLVLATPVYMFSLSGQLKIFLDRCYALMNPE
ncbi:MAG: flavodoxin family protein, partial [Candidatus Adiutrix sp.]|nr:flavodoxin family protein [Candidatus Adiutrix sp.]